MNSVFNCYVYMSSGRPQKRDNRFWRHRTVRFTCLQITHVWRRFGKHQLCRLVCKTLYGI